MRSTPTCDAARSRRRRAARTRSTLAQLAAWASERGIEPSAVDFRTLRRYAASLSEDGQAPATVARKLASLRGLFRAQVELGLRDENPADLLSAPKRPQRLPRVLKPSEVAELLDRIPATTPLEIRDRALFELAYASGLRAEELVSLEVALARLRRRVGPRRGQGRQDARRALRRARARALERYLARARPALIDDRSTVALFLSSSGRRLSTSDVRRRLRTWTRQSGARPATPPARASALVRDPSARGWRRRPRDSGAARPRQHLDYSGLHSGRVATPEISLRARASTGVAGEATGNERQSDRAAGPLEEVQGLGR